LKTVTCSGLRVGYRCSRAKSDGLGKISGLVDIAQDFVSTGGNANDGLKLALKGVLLSPHFLYREMDGTPTDAYNIAARLSFGLWDSMPDPELVKAATSGALTTREQVAQTVAGVAGYGGSLDVIIDDAE